MIDVLSIVRRGEPVRGAEFDFCLATLAHGAIGDRTWEIFRLFAEHRDPGLLRAFYKARDEDFSKRDGKPTPYSVDTARMYLQWGKDYLFAEEQA